GLTAEVTDVGHFQADFFAHLARDSFFERLTRLNKSGEHTEKAVGESFVARQQQLVTTPNEHDHRRTDARKAEQAAVWAQLGPLGGGPHQQPIAAECKPQRGARRCLGRMDCREKASRRGADVRLWLWLEQDGRARW